MRVKVIIQIFLCLILVTTTLCGIFIFNTLSEVDLNRLSLTSGVTKSGESSFDAGSIVNKDEFSFYISSTNKDGYLNSITDLESEGYIESKKDKIYILKNFKLSSINKNDCQRVYCFQHYIKFNKVPSSMWKALIGIEDLRFLEHSGVDLRAIIRALIVDIKEMKMVQGGSTLTQQLVKNLFLTSEKTLTRKVKELIISVYIESKFSKEDILELYFNEVFWGSLHGIQIKGLFAASTIYFQKSPRDLDPFESSILVSLLKGPGYYNPIRNLDRLKKRSRVVYNKLKEVSLVPTTNDYKWNDKQWLDWVNKLKSKSYGVVLKSFWWTSNEGKSDFEDYEKFVLKTKALTVLSKIDNENITFKGFVKNINNSKKYFFYSKYERSAEQAFSKEVHQIGSTIKPFVYSSFIKNGVNWEDTVDLSPITLDLISGKWTPSEASRSKVEELSVKESLQKSKNTAVIRLAQRVGFEKVEKDLKVYFENLKVPLKEYPAQLLGALELTFESYSLSYEMFLREACLGDSEIISVLSNPSETTIRNVVSKNLSSLRFFGKTGTTNKGYDNWFVSFDGENLYMFWTGFEGKRSGADLKLYGSTSSFRVFNDFTLDKGKRFSDLNCENFSENN